MVNMLLQVKAGTILQHFVGYSLYAKVHVQLKRFPAYEGSKCHVINGILY